MPHITLAKTRRTCIHKPESNAMYNNKRWGKIRNSKICDCPLCEVCLEVGKTTVAQLVHHKQPWQLAKDEDEQDRLQFDYDNLQSLCHECHNAIHHKLRIAAAYERKYTRK